MIVRHVMQFITIRQFPPADKSLPPLSKSRWWIPTGTKTLALISEYSGLLVSTVVLRNKVPWLHYYYYGYCPLSEV